MGMNGQEQQRVQADRRVTAYQVHARIYCAHVGINPDEMVSVPHPTLAGVATRQPQWYLIAERLFDLSMLLIALREGNARLQAANEQRAQEKAP